MVSPNERQADTQSSCINASSGSGAWYFLIYSISIIDSSNDSSFSLICSSNGKRINWLKHKKSNERRDNSFEDTKQF